MTLPLDTNPRKDIDAARKDLNNMGVSIVYHSHQPLDTQNRLVFLGPPQNMDTKKTKVIMEMHLCALEMELMATDEDNYLTFMHGQTWADFVVVREQPQGITCEQPAP